MDKRIKELAEQAAGNFTENFKWDHLLEIDKDIFENFAELIVRECAKWIEETDPDPDIGYEDAKELLQHFGIEE